MNIIRPKDFSKKLFFDNRPIGIDLGDTFYETKKHEIKFRGKEYRTLGKEIVSYDEYKNLIEQISFSIIKSEQIARNFFSSEEDIKYLYLTEMKYLDISYIDILSYGLPFSDIYSTFCQFDIGIECLNKEKEPIFIYDGRGICNINYIIDFSNNLKIMEVS
ncbi:hypothetical protein [Psychroserpens sp.]